MLLSVLSAVDSDLEGLFGAMWPAREEGWSRAPPLPRNPEQGRSGASVREERSRAWRNRKNALENRRGSPPDKRALRGHTGPNIPREAIRYNTFCGSMQ